MLKLSNFPGLNHDNYKFPGLWDRRPDPDSRNPTLQYRKRSGCGFWLPLPGSPPIFPVLPLKIPPDYGLRSVYGNYWTEWCPRRDETMGRRARKVEKTSDWKFWIVRGWRREEKFGWKVWKRRWSQIKFRLSYDLIKEIRSKTTFSLILFTKVEYYRFLSGYCNFISNKYVSSFVLGLLAVYWWVLFPKI